MLQKKQIIWVVLENCKGPYELSCKACRAPGKVASEGETCCTILYDELLLSCSDFSGLRKFPE